MRSDRIPIIHRNMLIDWVDVAGIRHTFYNVNHLYDQTSVFNFYGSCACLNLKYKISSRQDITKILQNLMLSTNQSITQLERWCGKYTRRISTRKYFAHFDTNSQMVIWSVETSMTLLCGIRVCGLVRMLLLQKWSTMLLGTMCWKTLYVIEVCGS